MSGVAWSDADVSALLELAGTCTDAQLSAYLGRTERSVRHRITLMRSRGEHVPHRRNQPCPFDIPFTGTLIAKTCVGCGKLREAELFGRTGDRCRYYAAKCKICQRSRSKKHEPAKLKEKTLQDISIEHATRSHQPYTSDELVLIEDTSHRAFDLAITLGRTYYAICGQRWKLGIGERRDVKKYKDSHWVIHFPAAAKVLQEHFIRLGVPDDGWEEVA